jgi:hypothetical protein
MGIAILKIAKNEDITTGTVTPCSPQYEKHPHSMVPMVWKFPTKPLSRRLFNMGDGTISKIRSLVHPFVMSESISGLAVSQIPVMSG